MYDRGEEEEEEGKGLFSAFLITSLLLFRIHPGISGFQRQRHAEETLRLQDHVYGNERGRERESSR